MRLSCLYLEYTIKIDRACRPIGRPDHMMPETITNIRSLSTGINDLIPSLIRIDSDETPITSQNHHHAILDGETIRDDSDVSIHNRCTDPEFNRATDGQH